MGNTVTALRNSRFLGARDDELVLRHKTIQI